ncbi:transporter substrate-binding domain-containing protein [Bacillus sp. FJAT-47783]|uniref:transporter substrate-binding domain-containing protein n=1 Tax=Bacillus sp. FJAT-47783 TaxID=2922712 RepID=UPI001FAE6621|nr:transporter substrate-binding domain-containing protein [Bacillus sp. FJAT-47783]
MKKRFMFVVLLLMFFTLLVGCGTESSSSSSSDKGMKLVEEGKFTFAASGEYAPFSVTDGNGKMTGFDIDVANAVAEHLGLEPSQKKFKFAGIVEGVKTGRFDAAVASHTVTDERKEQVAFSTPYYYSGPHIFVRPDSDIQSMDDLSGKEVAVSKGSTYAKISSEATDNVIQYDSDVTALEALSNGKHDAVITDFVTGQEAIGNGLKVEGRKAIGTSEQAIAVAKDNTELLEKINEALEKMREDGTLKEISEKYIGKDITTKPE